MEFSLPTFTNYVDYDFRNDQAIDMLEELFWEQSFSSYNFYDYINLSQDFRGSAFVTPKEQTLFNEWFDANLGCRESLSATTSKFINDLSSLGQAYGLSLQMEDYTLHPQMVTMGDLQLLPFFFELNDVEDVSPSFK